MAAVLARTRADVDGPVGGPDRVLVVLDDDQGVAEVAQPDQGLDQPAVVPLVQADARLVQHVQHPDQAGADLGGEPDPLRLAAGQAAGRPAQREVVQADVEQEPQPLVDLLEHPLGDLALAVGELQSAEEAGGAVDRHVRDLGDVPAADGDRQRGRLEPGAVAGGARHLTHVAGETLPRGVGLRLGVPALDVGDDALVLGVVAALPAVPVAVAARAPGRARRTAAASWPLPAAGCHGTAVLKPDALGQRVDQPVGSSRPPGPTPTARWRPRPASCRRPARPAPGRPPSACRVRSSPGRRPTGR